MSLQTFFNNFALLADAPNGVVKLRELILQLAIRGQLNTQNNKDETAEKAIGKAKNNKGGLLFQTEPFETPFILPHGWAWLKLADLGGWAIGSGFPTNEQGDTDKPILFCKVSDMNLPGNEKWITKTQNSIDKETAKRIRAKAHAKGTIVFPKIGGAIATNKRRVLTRPTAIDNNCLGIIPSEYCSSDWLYLLLRSIDFTQYQSGTSVPALSQGVIGEIITALPPLEEQKRIVAKVDELMRLCDELEARQQARRESRVRLNNATLAPLNNAASIAPKEFDQASVRLADNFAALFDSAETVGKLRSTILQLAVQGKLVPHDPNDKPASALLKGIRKERDRLIKEKKIRQDKPLSPLSEKDVLFALPDGWEWSRLDSLCYLITDGTHYTPTYIPSGVPFLSVKDVTGGKINFSNTRFISPEEHEELSKRCKPEFQDILFTKVGTTGIAKVVDVETQFSIFVSLALLKFSKDYLSPYFLELLLNSPLVKDQSERDTQGVGNKNLVLKYIKNFVVPLPPLEEQKRIVAKVNQLMALCDELETKLRQTEADSEKLMKAAVRDLLTSVTGKEKSQRETALALSST